VEHFGHEIAGGFKLHEINIGRNYQAKSIERYDLIPPGGNRTALPDRLLYDCWKNHTGSQDVLGRLEWSKPALTIRTEFFKPEKGRYLHPQWSQNGRRFNRALTHAEAALIQGFDDQHLWCGTKVEIARQIGNAVPPPLAQAVAQKIMKALTDQPRKAEVNDSGC
jgi:DNA (cytosine-5)-methyltransferase 1